MTLPKLSKFFLLICILFLLSLIALWFAAPTLVRSYLNDYFDSQGEELELGQLSINFLPLSVSLTDLKISRQHKAVLSAKKAKAEIELIPLLARVIHFSSIEAEGVNLELDQNAQTWRVSGFDLGQSSSEEMSSNGQEEAKPWKFFISNASLINSQVNFTHTLLPNEDDQNKMQTDLFLVDHLQLDSLTINQNKWQGELALDAQLNQAHLNFSGQFQYLDNAFNADVQLKSAYIPFASVNHFLPESIKPISANFIGKGQFSLVWQPDNLDYFQLKNIDLTTRLDDLDGTIDNQHISSVSNKLKLDQTSLFISEEQMSLDGQVTFSAQQSQLDRGNENLAINQLTLHSGVRIDLSDLDGLKLQNNNLALALDDFSYEDKTKAATDLPEMELKKLSFAGIQLAANELVLTSKQSLHMEGKQVSVYSQQLDSHFAHNKRLVAWDKADLSGLALTSGTDIFDVQFDQLVADGVIFSQPLSQNKTEQNSTLPLAKIGQLTASKVDVKQDGVEIEKLVSQDLQANILLDAERHLENLVLNKKNQQTVTNTAIEKLTVPKYEEAKSAAASVSDANQTLVYKPPYYVIVKDYQTTGASKLYVQDKSIVPTLHRSLDLDLLSLKNLNTQSKDEALEFALKGRNGKYSTIDSNIKLWPLADELTMESRLKVREATLPPYSSYLAQVLGYQVESGQLDLDLTLNANKGQLSGNSHIVLRELSLGGEDKKNQSLVNMGIIPLSILVSLLQDDENNIDLNIPLTGNVDNPEFGWTGFLVSPVRKALYAASSSYFMQTFVPYANVISVIQLAGSQLLKVRVEPLIFKAKEASLNDEQDVFLKQLSALMKDKETSQLKACGVASYQDLGYDKAPLTIDATERQTAMELADLRAENLKDYLVEDGIASSRVFLCTSKIDLSTDSKPRIELNF